MPVYNCDGCGCSFLRAKGKAERSKSKYCCMQCFLDSIRTEPSPHLRSDGYIAITGGGVNSLQHRNLMESHIGRSLSKREHVHHKNGNRRDNRLENLEVLTIEDHGKIHAPVRVGSLWSDCTCVACGNHFMRNTKIVNNHPNTFCSRKCFKGWGFKHSVQICKQCGCEFSAAVKRSFCDANCYHTSKQIEGGSTEVCVVCGDTYRKTPWEVKVLRTNRCRQCRKLKRK